MYKKIFKNKIKSMITAMLVLSTCVILSSIGIKTAEGSTAAGTSGTLSLDESNYPLSLRAPRKYLTTAAGTFPVSCFTPTLSTPNPGTTFSYQYDYTSKDVQSAIFYYGYPANDYLWRNYGISEADALYYTQAASWIESNYANRNHRYNNAFLNDLLTLAENNYASVPDRSSRYISLSASSLTLSMQSDGTQISNPVTVNSNTTGEVTLNTNNGMYLLRSDGVKTNTIKVGESFRIVAPKEYVGTHDINFSAKHQDEHLSIWSNGNGAYQTLILPLKQYKTSNLSIKVTGIQGEYTITKTNESGQLLTGVEFKLYSDKECTNLIGTYTTSNGKFTMKNLIIGTTYYLKESKSLNGYELKTDVYEIVVPNGSTTASKTITNKKKEINVVIDKVDSKSNKKIAGVTLLVTGRTIFGDSYEKEIITSESGVNLQLQYGNYQVKEVKAVNGYQLSSQIISFTVNDSTEDNIVITFKNNRINKNIIIDKLDSVSNSKLAGAKLLVTGTNIFGESYYKEITSTTAGVKLELEYGDYELIELETIEGYELSTEVVKFTVDDSTINNTRIKFYNKRIQGTVSIVKLSNSSSKPIAGATIRITGNTKWGYVSKVIQTTTEPVKVDLYYGTYEIKETKAPMGYILDSTPQTVTIREPNELIEVSIYNERMKGTLELLKISDKQIDGKNVPLKDAVIGIYDKDKNLVSRVITDENGRASITLYSGSYYYKEISAPENYILDNTFYQFSIYTENQIIKRTLNNKLKPTPIPIPEAGGINVMLIVGIAIILISIGGLLVMNNKERKNLK